jgi:manganese oxidase
VPPARTICQAPFYDYLWGTTLARHDEVNIDGTVPRASGPDGNGGLVKVPGDFREIQGTMWAHDHPFFFTAEVSTRAIL